MSRRQSKNLTIDCVNRVKYERVEEFRTSIFEDVYHDAFLMTQEIIEENQKLYEFEAAEKFCNEDEIRNIISFIGQRGMGKSSAMLSYAFFLKAYANEGSSDKDFRFKGERISFFTLSKIDAAMLNSSESLFDIVIAKMWENFNKNEKNIKDEYLFARTREKFTSIKDSYTLYNTRDKNIPTIRQLKDLAKSLNLRQNFVDLVEAFLDCIDGEDNISRNRKYLVIPIDDLDMANESVDHIMEQLRNFFSIPRVIILTTADIDKLLMGIEHSFSDFYAQTTQNDLCSTYAEQYVAKVLPRNRRIYMPDFTGANIVQYTLEYKGYIQRLYNSKPAGGFDHTRYMNAIIARYIDVVLPRNGFAVDMRNNSLRDIANRLNELWVISKTSEANRTSQMTYEWMFKEVSIASNRMTNVEKRKILTQLLHLDEELYNEYLIREMEKELNVGRGTKETYGGLLKTMQECMQIDIENRELVSRIQMLYSAKIGYMLIEESYDVIENQFIRGDIFSTCIKERIGQVVELPVDIKNMMACKIEECHDDETLNRMVGDFIDRFHLLLFCDWNNALQNLKYAVVTSSENTLDANSQLEKQNSETQKPMETAETLFISVESFRVRVSVDNFFANAVKYEELFVAYVNWLEKQFECMGVLPQYKNIIDGVRINPKRQEMILWMTNNKITSKYSIAPVQDIGVLTNVVGKYFKMEMDNQQIRSIVYITKSLIDCLKEAFKEAEDYCEYEKMGYSRYSNKLEQMWDILKLEEIPQELVEKLGIGATKLEDTVV